MKVTMINSTAAIAFMIMFGHASMDAHWRKTL